MWLLDRNLICQLDLFVLFYNQFYLLPFMTVRSINQWMYSKRLSPVSLFSLFQSVPTLETVSLFPAHLSTFPQHSYSALLVLVSTAFSSFPTPHCGAHAHSGAKTICSSSSLLNFYSIIGNMINTAGSYEYDAQR